MGETVVTYDDQADILRVQFIPCDDTYVHYWDEHFGTLHNMLTCKVVGLHIEGWSIFKEKQTEDALALRAYVPSAQSIGAQVSATLNETKTRQPFVIDWNEF